MIEIEVNGIVAIEEAEIMQGFCVGGKPTALEEMPAFKNRKFIVTNVGYTLFDDYHFCKARMTIKMIEDHKEV